MMRTDILVACAFAAALVAPVSPLTSSLLLGQEAPPADEIRTLYERPAVQRALQFLEESDELTMRDLRTLTEIAAPPFMEARRGEAFLGMLRVLGVDTAYVDAEGNVIARRRGRSGSGTVAVAGHLDTVFPEGIDVAIRVAGDTLFAPGIGDDTRGLAAVLAILRAMNAVDIETEQDVLFIGTVGEEGLGDLRGMKQLFSEDGPRIDAFISIDGISDAGVTHQGLGSHRYRVTIRGPGGHSWGAFGLANPAHAMGRAIHYFDLAADAFTRGGPRTSYNVGMMEGGTSVNSVPFEVAVQVDMRSESQTALDEVDSLFQHSVRKAVEEVNLSRRRGPALTVAIDMIGDRPSGEVALEHPLVQRAMAVTRLLGIEPIPGRSSTDSNIPISLGVPAVTLGGGGVGGGVHSPGEWFLNRDGPRGIQRVLLVLLAQAGVAPVS